MQTTNLSFAKIVATPSPTAWSQVYNAGRLFLVLSLTTEAPSEDTPLTATGKQLINNLEAEFFSLEQKDLPSIKKAVTVALADAPEGITVSLSLAFVQESILYVLIFGAGKIMLKRHDKAGVLLASEDTGRSMHTASGYLQNNDMLVLETAQFAQTVPEIDMQKALELNLPTDIAETLTPNIHKADNGGTSAIILNYKGASGGPAALHAKQEVETEKETSAEQEEPTLADAIEETPLVPEQKDAISEPVHASREEVQEEVDEPEKPSLFSRLGSWKTKAFLLLAVVIAIALAGSVMYTVQQQQNSQRKVAADKVYDEAFQHYDEGSSLLTVGPSYAQEELLAAKKILDENIGKFPEGTEEKEKLSGLLQKVNTALGDTGQGKTIEAKTASDEQSAVLSSLKDQKGGLFSAADDDTLFVITANDILSFSSSGGSAEKVIENDNDWSSPAGLGAYNGNLYVLDKKEGVIKYVAGADGYGKATYFTDGNPDLSAATSMAIDGSVWILFSDGRISKYTKGAQESFKVSGLATPLRSPSHVFTTTESDFLYILDNGNSRIVKINKDGSFKSQYQINVAKNAKAMEIKESEKSAYLLSDSKLWQITID